MTWELVEAVKGADVARKALADYRSFLKEQVDAEVTMIEASNVDKAREKLEYQGSEAN